MMPILKTDCIPADVDASSGKHSTTSRLDDEPGYTLPLSASTSSGNRFRILRPWREGGLGKVSVALDEELQREVALKEIKYQHAKNKQSRSRFVLEAKLTGALEHPGIVPVYGLGHYADGRPFYAMRFIRGDSLEEAIDRFHKANGNKRAAKQEAGQRSVAFRELLGRFIDVCNAVAYAHSRGVLHRDLKPGNVMLGKYGETLVVDWGLAKAGGEAENQSDAADEAPVEIASASGAVPTKMGTLVGTPAYMSPEQAAGRLDLLGPASDVYSLGATLYYLLTGKAPFSEKAVATVLKKVQEGDFAPPREINKIPAALEAICLRAMATKPADRYRSSTALADDLQHWLADEPVAAYPEPITDRVRRWGRRRRSLVTGGVVLLISTTIALGIITTLIERVQIETELRRQVAEAAKTEAENQRLEAVAARKTAEENQKVAEQLAKESITRLRALARVHAQAGEWDEAAQDYVNCIDLSADGPTYQAPRKDVCREIARWDEVFERAVKLRPNDADLWIGRAEYRSIRGEWADAANDYQKVIHQRPIGDEMVDYASILVALARLEDYTQFCQEIAARHEEPHDRYSAFLTAWACSIGADSDVDRARVLELASRGVVGLRDKAARLNALGLAQYRADQLEGAIATLTDSNSMPWGSGGEPQKAVNWLVLAMADQRLGRTKEAQMCLHTARGLFDRARPNLPGEPAELGASEDWVMMNVLLREAESLGIGRLDWFAPGTEPEPYAVKFYRWTSRGPHSPPASWDEVISEPPVDEDAMDVIDYEWRKLGAPTPKCPSDYFGIVATTSRELPSGDYLIHASADDGVRIWIDDVLVIDEWHWQDGARDYGRVIHLEEGDHAIRIDYFQIDGDATLRFWMRPNGQPN